MGQGFKTISLLLRLPPPVSEAEKSSAKKELTISALQLLSSTSSSALRPVNVAKRTFYLYHRAQVN